MSSTPSRGGPMKRGRDDAEDRPIYQPPGRSTLAERGAESERVPPADNVRDDNDAVDDVEDAERAAKRRGVDTEADMAEDAPKVQA